MIFILQMNKQRLEKLNYFPKVSQQVGGRTGLWTQGCVILEPILFTIVQPITLIIISRHVYLKPRQAVLFYHFRSGCFSLPHQPFKLLEDFIVSLKQVATLCDHPIHWGPSHCPLYQGLSVQSQHQGNSIVAFGKESSRTGITGKGWIPHPNLFSLLLMWPSFSESPLPSFPRSLRTHRAQ